MLFRKRTTAPSQTNKYYLKAGKGGYNRAMEINSVTHSCLPNCCGLVHARWLESKEEKDYKKYDKLCTGDAHSYYKYKDGYKRGKEAKLGSIICFSKKKGYGHVAFVEDLKSNGDIITSNSGYNGSRFFLKTLKKSNNYSFGSDYELQGFIYPDVEFEEQYNLKRILKYGDMGDDVKVLQKELIKLKYNLGKHKADGIFGKYTKSAVISFQTKNKIASDGIVGKNTAHKLGWLFRGE